MYRIQMYELNIYWAVYEEILVSEEWFFVSKALSTKHDFV